MRAALRARPKFDFRAALEADGVRFEEFDWLTDGSWEAKDRRFRYRYQSSENVVDVAVRKSFNKWSDSVDFRFTPPRTERAYRKRMARLARAYETGQYWSGWGQQRWI